MVTSKNNECWYVDTDSNMATDVSRSNHPEEFQYSSILVMELGEPFSLIDYTKNGAVKAFGTISDITSIVELPRDQEEVYA